MNYSPYYNWYVGSFRQQYKPVTAYTLSVPVNVNGVNINILPYQALNYKPTGAQYEYVYVPIAQFSKVGAIVQWNEAQQALNVSTDYYTNKSELADCKAKLTAMQKDQPADSYLYEGKIEQIGQYSIGGLLWGLASTNETTGLTPGKYYKGYTDAPPPDLQPPNRVAWLMLIDDNGKAITFSTRQV